MQAIHDLGEPGERVMAQRWFSSDSSAERSFVWVSDVLGFDPNALRHAILTRAGRGRIQRAA